MQVHSLRVELCLTCVFHFNFMFKVQIIQASTFLFEIVGFITLLRGGLRIHFLGLDFAPLKTYSRMASC